MRWWGRGDSNSHAFRHMILSHARLPIPTLPHSIWGRLYPCELAGVERIGVRDRVFRLLDMVRMKRCQWDARVELVCITLGESAAPGTKKFLKNLPHLPQVPRSKLGRRRSSFGLRGSLAILNLPRICRTCRICPTLGRFGIFGDQLETLKHSAAVALLRLDSEDLPDGLVEAAGADGVVTVEDAPVLVGAVEDGAVNLIVWGRLLDALFEEEACGVGFLVEPIFGSDHLLAFGELAAFEKLAVFGDGAIEEPG